MKINNKVTIFTATILASMFLANNVNADDTVTTENTLEQPVTTNLENTVTETEKTTEEKTIVSKEGNEISVQNPNVKIDQENGDGKYSSFKVKYKDVKIPDNIEVNEGDKVTFDLPEEVKFQTSYEFDVHNPDKVVVGKATADATANKVTTVFNDYFKTHPLNKSMNLELDAQWTDKVESGKPVSVNFNGTVVTANIGKEQEIGKDELISKWGSQDKEDPTVINWTARINYAKRVLNNVTIIDSMSDNQKLVDDYLEVKDIESVSPWVDKGDAMNLVKSISKSEHGFEIKMNRLDRMIYLYYKTKLTNKVSESNNPTNKVELKADSDGSTSYSYVQLVGGRGNAVGENKPEPTWEIPNDAPKYDKPSINIEDIPKMPPAPILEKPYLPIEDIPLMPPAPILDKPYLPIEDVPLLPPAPILELPELKIELPNGDKPKETPKLNTPTPKVEIPNITVPSPNTPTTEVEIPEEQKYVSVNYNKQYVNKEDQLPNTGESYNNYGLLGLITLFTSVILYKKASKSY